MGNGEWGIGNGERGMGNGEWGIGNGEWGRGEGEDEGKGEGVGVGEGEDEGEGEGAEATGVSHVACRESHDARRETRDARAAAPFAIAFSETVRSGSPGYATSGASLFTISKSTPRDCSIFARLGLPLARISFVL